VSGSLHHRAVRRVELQLDSVIHISSDVDATVRAPAAMKPRDAGLLAAAVLVAGVGLLYTPRRNVPVAMLQPAGLIRYANLVDVSPMRQQQFFRPAVAARTFVEVPASAQLEVARFQPVERERIVALPRRVLLPMLNRPKVPDWSVEGKGDFDCGFTLGSQDHTVFMSLRWTATYANKRQWILNVGQYGSGAEHWLWSGGNSVGFGQYNAESRQITSLPLTTYRPSVIAATRSGSKYKIFFDGELVASKNNIALSITNSAVHVGTTKSGRRSQSDFDGPIFETQLFKEAMTPAGVFIQSDALKWKYRSAPDWSGQGKGVFDTGLAAPGQGPHTIIMALLFPFRTGGKREWILNFGQWNDNAEHWIWNDGDDVQIGCWGRTQYQISTAPARRMRTIATVYDGTNYHLYLDGQRWKDDLLYGDADRALGGFNINSNQIAVGQAPPISSDVGFSGDVWETQLYMRALDPDEILAKSELLGRQVVIE